MKKSKLLILLACASFLTACNPSTYEDISSKEEITSDFKPTYTDHFAPVLKNNCVGCHSAGGQFPNLTDYTNVKDATQNGDLMCRISGSCGGIMPPSGALSKQTIDVIKLWQEQGYKE